ncbi:hypothetical protein N9562_00310 [Flavobacteriaceae bacterium]|nr:hypothetical protein [Flavobacteriaceae bacterium]
MEKPTEVFRQTECGMYEVSNYSNIRTTPYRFFKGKKLIESKNEPILIADVSASKREAIILINGWGYSTIHLKKKVNKVFSEYERFEVREYREYLDRIGSNKN